MRKRIVQAATAVVKAFNVASRNALFPLGLACVAYGIALIAVPAGVIAAGVALCVIGWAVE